MSRCIPDNVKRLVAWNPFAFNVAESFLDAEWMFGVKDGFDVVIGNPPYKIVSKDMEAVGNKELFQDWLKVISGKNALESVLSTLKHFGMN